MTKKKKNKSKETATVVKISVEEVPVSRILKQLKLRSKKMPRKRNKNNRIDYRSGGRAQFQPGGTVEIPAFKTQAQFFKEYDEINPPPPVNKMTVKRRQEHSANRAQAYTDYTTDYVANQQQATQEAINSAVGIAIKNYDAQMKADAATRARSQNTNNTANTGFRFEGNPEDLAQK